MRVESLQHRNWDESEVLACLGALCGRRHVVDRSHVSLQECDTFVIAVETTPAASSLRSQAHLSPEKETEAPRKGLAQRPASGLAAMRGGREQLRKQGGKEKRAAEEAQPGRL